MKIQCTLEEIAAFFSIDIVTIENFCKRKYGTSYSKVFRQKRGSGKVSLRRAQWKKGVEEGNTTMLIWLGKQYLGQRDKVEEVHTDESGSKKTIDDVISSILKHKV